MTTLHAIHFEPSRQEKAVWALNNINPGMYTWDFHPDGSVTWHHASSQQEGDLDLDYFVREYDILHSATPRYR